MEIDEIPIVNDPQINKGTHLLDPKDVPTIDEEVRMELRKLGSQSRILVKERQKEERD